MSGSPGTTSTSCGVALAGLTWVGAADLGAWASDWPDAHSTSRDAMLAHHQVVQAIHAAADCLPVRFPTLVDDAAAGALLLATRREALLAALARVQGATELAVTLAWDEHSLSLWERAVPSGQAPRTLGSPHTNSLPEGEGTGQRLPEPGGTSAEDRTAGAGTRYLLARRRALAIREARATEAARLADQLLAPLALHSGRVKTRLAPNDRVAASIAILVPRGDAPHLKTRLAATPLPGVRLVVNGPWPPYSFAAVE